MSASLVPMDLPLRSITLQFSYIQEVAFCRKIRSLHIPIFFFFSPSGEIVRGVLSRSLPRTERDVSKVDRYHKHSARGASKFRFSSQLA